MEKITAETKELSSRREKQKALRRNRRATRRSNKAKTPISLMSEWTDWDWEMRWWAASKNDGETTWDNPWIQYTGRPCSKVTKFQFNKLFLLCTEIIQFNTWLSGGRVSRVNRPCLCALRDQTIQHVTY